MPKIIRITVPKTGLLAGDRKVTIETDGFIGTSCRDATKAIEEALGGGHRAASQAKPALYETEQTEHVSATEG